MRNFVVSFLCGLALAGRVSVAAHIVNFTAAEGYSSGPIREHPDWSGNGGFKVDPTGTGTLSIRDIADRKHIYYHNSLKADSESFQVSIGFSFKRTDTDSLSRNRNFISVELNQETKASSSGVALRLQRQKRNPKRYRLVVKKKSNGDSYYSSKTFDEKLLGFSRAADLNSDSLELELKLNRGVNASSWTASCTIRNNKTGRQVINFMTNLFQTDDAYFSSDLFPVIGSNDKRESSLIFKKVIDYFHATSTPKNYGLKQPNVLFIAVDDLNDWTGLWKGHPDALTPNLDRLARMGLRFTNAHCSVPACNPSRASLLSGMRPATTGLYENKQNWFDSPRLNESVTLPQHFRNHGYYAASVGKIFHKEMPNVWDEDAGLLGSPLPPRSQIPLNGLDLPSTSKFDWGPVDADKSRFIDWKSADYTIQKMTENPETPFFLACGFIKPHIPWYVPQEYFDRFPLEDIDLPVVKEGDLDDIPQAGKDIALRFKVSEKVFMTDGAWRKAVQAYLASTAFMDDSLGRILDALETHPEKDNTIIVLWSDHGYHLGEKMHFRKFALWEEATRVPLIVVAPGMTTPNTETTAPVSLLDIYPTLLDLCGLPADPREEGNSLAPLLKDWTSHWNHVAITEHGYKNRSVRTYRWRYILYADGSEELYDHRDDPNEWINLANQTNYEKTKRWLRKRLPESYVRPPEEFVGAVRS